jgi:hypothetical protein
MTNKTNPQKILKAFLVAKEKTDIKPELQAIYVDNNKLICTDAYRMNILNYELYAN